MAAKKAVRKPPNVAQRVEVLLVEGVEGVAKWSRVRRYDEPSDEEKEIWASNEDCASLLKEWQRLRDHHNAETAFLLEMLKEMREQIIALDEQLDQRFKA